MNFYLGLDFGTSGARAIAIDAGGKIYAEVCYPFDGSQNAMLAAGYAYAPPSNLQKTPQFELSSIWQSALFSLLAQIPLEIRREVRAIAIDGTSSTVMLCDADGTPVAAPMLYNDARGVAVMDKLRAMLAADYAYAPPNPTVLSATSSLAKLLWLTTDLTNKLSISQRLYFLHQADWLGFLLHGKLGVSDYHNALKLGYDVANLCYPEWLTDAIATIPNITIELPEVVAPGTIVGEITAEMRDRFSLPPNCIVRAGTTDSIAAFLASGAKSPGEASTSLGSTLVLKLLSRTRIDNAKYGIYSHKLGDLWLVGGASNTGGAVLRHFFTDAELDNFSRKIDPSQESLLDYYPLLKPGDRFPINDPNLPPKLEPRPKESVEFLHGLLESIARIEARGYQLLQELGATPLTRVYTAGGGAKNPIWTAIRSRLLKVPIITPISTESAYGTALLAMDKENN